MTFGLSEQWKKEKNKSQLLSLAGIKRSHMETVRKRQKKCMVCVYT